MKTLIVGSGSIAQRYALILEQYFSSEVFFVTDYLTKNRRPEKIFSRKEAVKFFTDNNVTFDFLIIASINSLHLSDFKRFNNLSKRILIEKPLLNRPLNARELSILQSSAKPIFVSSPLRFHEAFLELKKLLSKNQDINRIEVRCQSWLPDWRKDRNFQEGFWNQKGEGGVLRELIHELDYVTHLFGNLKVIWATKLESKALNLNVESGVNAILKTRKGILLDLYLDFSTISPRRYIRIDSDKSSITWDVLNGTIETTSSDGQYFRKFDFDLDRNLTFSRQIRAVMKPETWSISPTTTSEANLSLKLVNKIYSASHR